MLDAGRLISDASMGIEPTSLERRAEPIGELEQNGWTPIPQVRLPFPSIVAASTNDPLGRFDRISQLAEHWGSRVVNLGAVGHLNPASGFREWPRAQQFVEELSA